MKTHSLRAEKRTLFGRKVKTLRNQGILPANVFGKKIKSVSIQLSADEFAKVFKEAGETGIINLSIAGKESPVLVFNTQTHPVTDELVHIDFRQVNLKEKITATVPVILEGESPAEKSNLGILVQQAHEVEVEALPADLPESLNLDISVLTEADQSLSVSDIKYDSKKISILTSEDQIIAIIAAHQKVEEAPVIEEEVDGEAEGEPTEESSTEETPSEEK